MSEKLTPMMHQYQEIKKAHRDAILFYRMGDFYEMFFDDAVEASKILGIVLTTRDKGKKNPVAMCGVPYHSSSTYISRLIKAGRKVAVCEQGEIEGKGLVRREVVQVLTPGLVNDENHLEGILPNYIMAVSYDEKSAEYGISFADITTGDFRATSIKNRDDYINEISRISPKEIISTDESLIPEGFYSTHIEETLSYAKARDVLCKHFKTASITGLGLEDSPAAVHACASALIYIRDKQPRSLGGISRLNFYNPGLFLILSSSTRRNLELFESMSASNDGALFNIINATVTAMGARRLSDWLSFPLMDETLINDRLDALGELKENPGTLNHIRSILKGVYDLERILGRIISGRAMPRDLGSMAQGLEQVPLLNGCLSGLVSPLLSSLRMDEHSQVADRIRKTLVDEPPAKLGEAPVVREGMDPELDELRDIRRDSRKWIAEHEAQQKTETGISTLKIGYNRVFGYYIEVTNSQIDKVPQSYIRKQTLVNAERYITPELKEYEVKLLNAQDSILKIETRIFNELKEFVASKGPELRLTIDSIITSDVLSSLAYVAQENNYVRPSIVNSRGIDIRQGRHPVVEKVLKAGEFVPNDCRFDAESDTLHIVTGPNMAGKSTYMRQIAQIVIMAQAGSFVPASSAVIGVTDRVFTRIGAADNLTAGQSTFMVEMSETADILKNATANSLVILDEIGRGTSTYDGMSLAWAVAEYLDRLGARTFFATHYHELADLARRFKGIKNFHMAIEESGHDVIFIREVRRGAIGRSYGIHVAKLAGIPEEVIANARLVLASIDRKARTVGSTSGQGAMRQASIFDAHDREFKTAVYKSKYLEILNEILDIDLTQTKPIEALNLLYSIKERLSTD